MSEANHHQKQQRHAAKGHDLETVTGQRQVKEQVLRADAARISHFALYVACRLMQTASVLLECSDAFQHSAELFKNGSSIAKQMAQVLFSIPMELLAGYGLK